MSNAITLLHETEILETQISSLLENTIARISIIEEEGHLYAQTAGLDEYRKARSGVSEHYIQMKLDCSKTDTSLKDDISLKEPHDASLKEPDLETGSEETQPPNMNNNQDDGDFCFEGKDDDKQVLMATFEKLDINGNGKLSWNEIEAALREFPQKGFINNIDLGKALKDCGVSERDEIDIDAFEKSLSMFPRAHGQRIQWARSLNLDALLASHLPPGTLYDELAGIKELDQQQIRAIIAKFMQCVEKIFITQWGKLKQDNTTESLSVDDAINKFSGDIGKFGDPGMFHEGLENQIRSPDPYVLKAIFREHLGDGSEVNQITSNYKIIFNSATEFSRLFGHPQEYGKDLHISTSKLGEKNTHENSNIPIVLLEVAKGLIDVNGPTMA